MILSKIHYVLLGSRTNSMKCGMMAQYLPDHMPKSRISKMLRIHFGERVVWNGRSPSPNVDPSFKKKS